MTNMYLDHALVMRIWVVLGKTVTLAEHELDAGFSHLRALAPVMKDYVDDFHHAKEELHLFPVLRTKHSGNGAQQIRHFLRDHQRARTLVGVITSALKEGGSRKCWNAVRQYRDLLFNHVERENAFFNKAECDISPESDEQICLGFRQVEEKMSEIGTRDRARQSLEAVEQSLAEVEAKAEYFRPRPV